MFPRPPQVLEPVVTMSYVFLDITPAQTKMWVCTTSAAQGVMASRRRSHGFAEFGSNFLPDTSMARSPHIPSDLSAMLCPPTGASNLSNKQKTETHNHLRISMQILQRQHKMWLSVAAIQHVHLGMCLLISSLALLVW